jgi:hypothetical protein
LVYRQTEISKKMASGEEQLPDEIVYRRIAESSARQGWINEAGKAGIAAFLPNKGDADGLSLDRGTAAEAGARGKKGKRYFVVPVRVAEIRKHNLPFIVDGETHATLEGWTFAQRDSLDVRSGAEHLASICGKPEGPFDGQADVS